MTSQYHLATTQKKDELWQQLSTKTIADALSPFLNSLTFHTKNTYANALRRSFQIFAEKSLITTETTLQTFSLCNMENLLDCLNSAPGFSVTFKNMFCCAFVSFTKYLCRKTEGMIRAAIPLRSGSNATFKKVRLKAATKALTHEEYTRFIDALKMISFRDYIIAKAIMQGAKRVNEVLLAKIDQIDWDKKCITYKQSKTDILEKTTVIHYSDQFMKELRHYLFERTEGYIFLTKNHKPIATAHLSQVFKAASKRAGLSVNVHPHMLRATCITLLMRMGYHSDDIMRVSGHANQSAVVYYDKRPDEENITRNVRFA